jgi:hypothetical protein
MYCVFCGKPADKKPLVVFDGFHFHPIVCLPAWLKWKEANRGPTLRVENRGNQ